MKKAVFLLALAGVLVVLTCVQVVVSQDTAKGSFSGKLLRYNNVIADCSGSTVNDVGHVIQFSTNGGSTWIDGPTTDSNSNFSYTPTVHCTCVMYVKAKNMRCDLGDHPHIACGSTHFPYAYGSSYNADLNTIYSVGCGGQK